MTLDELLDMAREQRTTARVLTRRAWYRTLLVGAFAMTGVIGAAAHVGDLLVLGLVGVAGSLYLWLVAMNDLRWLNKAMRQTQRDFRVLAARRRGR